MAATASNMLPLNTPAPDFALPDTTGRIVARTDFTGKKALLVMFICNHCPFVQLIRGALADLGREYQFQGIGMVAINANDADRYPDDSPEKMIEESARAGYTFPYLYDATQETAKAYRAACTPDFFLFDAQHRLVYRGQFDDARPGNGRPVTGADLRAALDAVLGGNVPDSRQRPSLGCGIKWKPGNEPG